MNTFQRGGGTSGQVVAGAEASGQDVLSQSLGGALAREEALAYSVSQRRRQLYGGALTLATGEPTDENMGGDVVTSTPDSASTSQGRNADTQQEPDSGDGAGWIAIVVLIIVIASIALMAR